jgi:RNA polymerase sigma-70 factor, ECF subfamily
LIRTTGDWDLAEECTQDAFARAIESWGREGVPRNPGAWLTTTARNRAYDRLRRAKTGVAKEREAAIDTMSDAPSEKDRGLSDDRLRLIFTCCHPALSLEAQVALTLRTLAGLTTAEIARAFLIPEPTMAKRLVRAKAKIRNAGIPYRVPPDYQLPERTVAVLAVLYLLFNEGYGASEGNNLIRQNLCNQAIHLTRTLAQLMPDEPEVLGLLALMVLHDARRLARVDESGELVPLEEQNRDSWDSLAVSEGTALLDTALRRRNPGPYQVQAAIAACHATATDPIETDWRQIAKLYDRLVEMVPTPVIALNRVVAVAMAEGPAKGLLQLDALEGSALSGYYLLPATRADLLRRLGHHAEASEAYRAAIELAPTDAERRYLSRRLTELSHHL